MPRGGREEVPGVSIEIEHAFGSHCGTSLRDSIFFADAGGEYLVHPVGRLISFRHLESGVANYVLESPQVQALTACTVSRNRHWLAVGERCAAKPFTQVTLYNLRATSEEPVRQPARTLQDLGSVGHICCAAFSADAEASLLVLASRPPELLLVVLDWRSNHVIGRFQLADQVDRVAFSPFQDGVVSASGPDTLRLLRLPQEADQEAEGAEASAARGSGRDGEPTDDELSAMPAPVGLSTVPSIFNDHAWLEPADGLLVVCTEEGQVHVIYARAMEPPALLRTIAAPFQLRGQAPRCVRCFPGGFILGGGEATLALWERSGPRKVGDMLGQEPQAAAQALQHIRTACVAPGVDAAICCIDIAGAGPEDDEDGTSQNKLELVALGFNNRNVGHLRMAEFRRPSMQPVSELLCGGFHPGPIVSIDMAVQRPLVVSACRTECAVRIWNYVSRRCELRWEFPGEEPISVAMHPMGYVLAVGFHDKFRMMQVFVEELKLYREVSLRGVRLLRFSNGGHLLAVAQGKLVLVFSIKDLAKVATLRGHSQQVVSVSFDPDDRSLTTCVEDGSIVEWSTLTWAKVQEYAADRSLGGEVRSVAAGAEGHTCVSLVEGARYLLRSFRQCSPVASDELQLPYGMQLRALQHHRGELGITVLGAASTGGLWWCSGLTSRSECKEFGLHAGACMDLCLSADARMAVTAGEDGTIFVLKVKGLASGDAAVRPIDNEVVMVTQGEIQAREEEIQRLAAEAVALKAQLVEDTARMQSDLITRVAAARAQDQEAIRLMKLKAETLQQQATVQERERLRQMKAMEAKHVQAADQLEAAYDKRFRKEAERFSAVEAELRQLVDKLEALREEGKQKLENQRARQRQEFQKRVGEKDMEVQKLKDLIAFSQQRFDTMLDQEVMEYELETGELVRKSQNELEQQRLVEYKLKKEQDTMVRGLDMMEKDRERGAKEQAETNTVLNNLTAEVERLQKEVAGLKSERRDREAALREKELEIGTYKSKVNTLKKFKHVLDFRLREVTHSLQPKDETIAELGSQLQELEEEFEHRLESHKVMQATLQKHDAELKEAAAECARLRDTIKQRDRDIFRFTEDLRELATNEQDVRKWPDGLRRIYKTHGRPELLSKDAGSQAMQELDRQITVTDKKAGTMAAKIKSSKEECRADIRKHLEENSELIQELDKLRKDRKDLQAQVKQLELKVQVAEQRRTRAKELAPAIADGAGTPDSSRAASACSRIPPKSALTSATQDLFGRSALSQAPTLASDGSLGRLRKAGVAHRSAEERQMMQKLLAAADVRSQQAQMQRLEQKLLQDQLEHLLKQRPASRESMAAGNVNKLAAPLAGAGFAAVRAA